MSEVTLKTSQGATYQPPESEISDLKSKGIYTSATVVRGTYFFYKNKDYNKDGTDTSVQIKEGETKDISGSNGSFYALPHQQQGIVLFAHPHFNGHHEWYEDSSSDITNSFPATNGPGVSSAILLSKAETWELCQGTAYGPPHFNLSGATKLEYPLPDDLGGLNDAVRSLRRA